MHYESGLLILFFVILALIIGAFVRHGLKNLQVPYTVVLLIIGLCLGLVHRTEWFNASTPLLANTLDLVADISPHIIMFVFLPTLIFESAFAMEVHLFRRMFTQIALLAIPGLLLAIALTASLAKWVFPWDWSWALCFLFGALISATDPVAVVALLKEVSSRKRLETLIEGESLLNDGTAIVFFSLFYGWVISTADVNVNILAVAGQFTWVVSVGLAIGVALGGLCIIWIGRVFNDPMIEITLSIAAAYLVFFIAESIHVSGVVSVVALALMFASIGRTRVSPEVAGFLHHFWEMMAHIANTLIFLLVGVLIAARVPLNDIELWKTLFILYIGILFIRGFAIMVFMPILKRIGIGITNEKAIVLLWGGLRGAVSLALALTIAADDLIPKVIGDQILFLCAGIVVLTILVNGSSMGLLLKWLGLNKLPDAKQATVDKASLKIHEALNDLLPGMIDSEFLKGADWQDVKKAAKLGAITKEIENEAETISDEELAIAFQRRLLETERKNYWTQFEQGTLGKQATNILVGAVEKALDGEPQIGPRQALYRVWRTPPILDSLRHVYGIKQLVLSALYERLALGYDVARGFIQAQDELHSHIKTLAPCESQAELVHDQVEQNKTLTVQHIQQIRESFPEVVNALETQAASRLLLNRERAVIQQQLKQAVLDMPEAVRMINDVETRMEALQKSPLSKNPVQIEQWQRLMPWTKDTREQTRTKLVGMMQHSIYNDGDMIAEQGKSLCALGIVAQGTVVVSEIKDDEKVSRLIGPGENFAGLSLLSTSSPANYQAQNTCNIVWLQGEQLKTLMTQDVKLSQAIAKLML